MEGGKGRAQPCGLHLYPKLDSGPQLLLPWEVSCPSLSALVSSQVKAALRLP